jgi:Ca2+-binding EF-hand superfamily protein
LLVYLIKKDIDIDEAFRLADFDFDGFLSQSDIRLFLIKFLGVNEKEILSAKLERLFKLLDTLKRGKIQKTDLQKILGKSAKLEVLS